jgi:thiosulfate/3-mercaptopyruvate sulfurtransferase
VSDIAIEELSARLGDVAILDVRTPHEYDGSLGKPCDPRQGHIPGALNLDVYRLMELSPGDATAAVGLAPGAEIVAYCHSGGRSAFAAQVLRSLGFAARNYPGSWHEWSRHESLPIEG